MDKFKQFINTKVITPFKEELQKNKYNKYNSKKELEIQEEELQASINYEDMWKLFIQESNRINNLFNNDTNNIDEYIEKQKYLEQITFYLKKILEVGTNFKKRSNKSLEQVKEEIRNRNLTCSHRESKIGDVKHHVFNIDNTTTTTEYEINSCNKCSKLTYRGGTNIGL